MQAADAFEKQPMPEEQWKDTRFYARQEDAVVEPSMGIKVGFDPIMLGASTRTAYSCSCCAENNGSAAIRRRVSSSLVGRFLGILRLGLGCPMSSFGRLVLTGLRGADASAALFEKSAVRLTLSLLA